MGADTKIEWAHHTFNPWIGCTNVGPGCDHCYAETLSKVRFGVPWGPGQPRRRTRPGNWAKPLQWDRDAAATGTRYRVFCASLADVFDNEVDPAWRADLFDLIERTQHLDWLLLTKRIGNVEEMLPPRWWPMPDNVIAGATMVNQAEIDRDWRKLAAVAARRLFVSIEPMLGPVVLPREFLQLRPWIIVGGESGRGARPMHPGWARDVRDQCAEFGAPFLFKQWGDWAPGEIYTERLEDGGLRGGLARFPDVPGGGTFPGKLTHWWDEADSFTPGPISVNIGKKAAGRLLDGVQHDGYPRELEAA